MDCGPNNCSCKISPSQMFVLILESAVVNDSETPVFMASYELMKKLEEQFNSTNNIAILTLTMSMLIHKLAHKIEDEINNSYMNPN